MSEQESALTCETCARPLRLGSDAISVQRCVIGPRGIVPIEDLRLFCDDECLHDRAAEDEPSPRSRRIP